MMVKIKYPENFSEYVRREGIGKLSELMQVIDKLQPVWGVRPDFIHNGTPKPVSVTGTAATPLTDLRPGVGKRWLVIVGWGYHDDTSNRNASWRLTDGTTTIEGNVESIGADAYRPINAIVNFGQPTWSNFFYPLILTHDVYLQLNIASIGSGKKGYIEAFVLELDDD